MHIYKHFLSVSFFDLESILKGVFKDKRKLTLEHGGILFIDSVYI